MNDEAEPTLSATIEAVLLVADEPVADVTLAQVLERPRDEVAATLAALADDYNASGRGFELREVAGGWRLYTRPECAPIVERFVLDGQQARLTQAALETLAVVAYRQPVSRARVSAVRGVNCDGVMRTLTTRGLIEEAGVDLDSGAMLFQTTSYFLERLGMASLDELPPIGPYLPDATDLADLPTDPLSRPRTGHTAGADAEVSERADLGAGEGNGDPGTDVSAGTDAPPESGHTVDEPTDGEEEPTGRGTGASANGHV